MPAIKFNAPRGTNDILPSESHSWQMAEAASRRILRLYGYREIRTPYFEESELFVRSVGQTSDIVQKQMLHLAPQGTAEAPDGVRSKLVLRPEGTAAVARAYIQHNLDKKENLSKLFYWGPMFRGERPQKGRLRQFHQIGVEAIGPNTTSPFLDAEVMALSLQILTDLGLKDFNLQINTLGSLEDKKNFAQQLRRQLENKRHQLCPDCQDRFQRNVFRILDCKNKDCRRTVHQLNIGDDHLAPESRDYFQQVCEALQVIGVPFQVDPFMVRGLDYYTHTVFEITTTTLGSQDALGAGGRYNNLIKQIGGGPVDAVGFALGLERILLARPQSPEPSSAPLLDFYMISLDNNVLPKSFELVNRLRQHNLSADLSTRISSLKSQMRTANKSGARLVGIRGTEEDKNASITVKDMQTGHQRSVAETHFIQTIKAVLQQ